jgi:hypothetical protein
MAIAFPQRWYQLRGLCDVTIEGHRPIPGVELSFCRDGVSSC